MHPLPHLKGCIDASWRLQAQGLSEQYRESKLLACKLMCKCMLRRHDLDIDESLLSRFYAALHSGLLHSSAVRARTVPCLVLEII